MALIRLVEYERMMYALYALGPHIPSINLRSPLTSSLQAGEIGLGTAADKDACTSLYGKPTQFHDPLNRAPLQLLPRVVSYTTVGIHGSGKRFDQNTGMGRSRVNPPGEARVPVPLGKRQDHVFNKSERLLEWLSFRWKFLFSNSPVNIV